jgi:hypothetical protein
MDKPRLIRCPQSSLLQMICDGSARTGQSDRFVPSTRSSAASGRSGAPTRPSVDRRRRLVTARPAAATCAAIACGDAACGGAAPSAGARRRAAPRPGAAGGRNVIFASLGRELEANRAPCRTDYAGRGFCALASRAPSSPEGRVRVPEAPARQKKRGRTAWAASRSRACRGGALCRDSATV